MSHISDFATLYPCTVWPYVGRDRYGNITWGSPVYIPNIWYAATSELFKNDDGAEIVAKYKIISPDTHKDILKRKNMIALDGDFTTQPDPVEAGAFEIQSARLIKVPFEDVNDELIVMV